MHLDLQPQLSMLHIVLCMRFEKSNNFTHHNQTKYITLSFEASVFGWLGLFIYIPSPSLHVSTCPFPLFLQGGQSWIQRATIVSPLRATCPEPRRTQGGTGRGTEWPGAEARNAASYKGRSGRNGKKTIARWSVSKIFWMFIPIWGKIRILTHIFQMPWKHQLENQYTVYCTCGICLFFFGSWFIVLQLPNYLGV